MLPAIDRRRLFDALRDDPFPGRLTQRQVEGMSEFLDEWHKTPFDDLRWLAYAMGTQPVETAWTMQPIEEQGRGAGEDYGNRDPGTGQAYFGRGYVQLTWKENYARASTRLRELDVADVDLVKAPNLALLPHIAAPIMAYGMAEGWFTGHSLAEHFDAERSQWKQARRIVNRMDRADEIAGHARAFYKALAAAADAAVPVPPVGEELPAEPGAPSDELAQLVDRIKQLTGARTVSIEL